MIKYRHFNNENTILENELLDRRESERNNRRFINLNQNQNEIMENSTHDQNQHERDINESGIEILHHQIQENHHHSLVSPVNDNQVDLTNQSTEQIIEVEDSDLEIEDPSISLHVNTPVRHALNTFGNYIFDIYQSSAYYLPSQYSPSRNRFQYMTEYYRRMVHLIEESSKQEAASEETIEHLCVVCISFHFFDIKDIFFSVDWCPICLEDYLDNMVTTVLPCKISFQSIFYRWSSFSFMLYTILVTNKS